MGLKTGWATALSFLISATGVAGEVQTPGSETKFPLRSGDLLGHDRLVDVRPWLPGPIWEQRENVFAARAPRIGELGIRSSSGADCGGDPEAAARIVWSVARDSGARGRAAIWSYAFWEPNHDAALPDDARGVTILTYRSPQATTPADEKPEFWIYLPQREAPAEEPRPPAHMFSCLGAVDVLAPNPTGLAELMPGVGTSEPETWSLREAWIIRFEPASGSAPYQHSVFYIDRTTRELLFAFAYDQEGELWRLGLGRRHILDARPRARVGRTGD